MSPKISVIIPTKDREASLVRSLESVYSQTLKPFEVIVIDDGSTNNTSEFVLKKFPETRMIVNKHSKGGAVARNQGAKEAKGDFLAFLDSDDEWMPHHLATKIEVLTNKKADGVFGTFYLVKGEKREEIFFDSNIARNLNIGNAILSIKRFDARTSTFLFKKSAFYTVKFDENLKKHQDWDLAINFDTNFNFVLDENPSVQIFVEQGEERMSQKLQHKSSFYFINKNSKYIEANNIFMFCLKQIMRSQMAKESGEIINRYLMVISPYFNELTVRNKILFRLLKAGLLNIGRIYILRNKIKQPY
ncbi:glycosyltransferase family 2 protein [Christiangramia aquimixticola]|uniref:glycosyltransferase family 2 protein n=1 Tax=Christiangramia aquimixticola TaxID=1697558 RepID=UPI003AA9C001